MEELELVMKGRDVVWLSCFTSCAMVSRQNKKKEKREKIPLEKKENKPIN